MRCFWVYAGTAGGRIVRQIERNARPLAQARAAEDKLCSFDDRTVPAQADVEVMPHALITLTLQSPFNLAQAAPDDDDLAVTERSPDANTPSPTPGTTAPEQVNVAPEASSPQSPLTAPAPPAPAGGTPIPGGTAVFVCAA
jgi:hypothetical protein